MGVLSSSLSGSTIEVLLWNKLIFIKELSQSCVCNDLNWQKRIIINNRGKLRETLKKYLSLYARVVQLVEHITFNDGVGGSNPLTRTNILIKIRSLDFLRS